MGQLKTFLVINGKNAYIKQAEKILTAEDWAVNIMDHSQELIVREIETLQLPGGLALESKVKRKEK